VRLRVCRECGRTEFVRRDNASKQCKSCAARKAAGRVQLRCAVRRCWRIARTVDAGFGLRSRSRRAAAAVTVREHVRGWPHPSNDSVELAAVLSASVAAS
jgi:hypothetical protein